MKNKKIKTMCFISLFSAIICVCTFVSVPLPIGYFNLGDTAILISSCILSPICALFSAAIGSVLADILMGYILYAPATFIIKSCVSVISYLLVSVVIHKKKCPRIFVCLAFMLCESFVPIGYFIYEFFLLGYGVGAAVSLPSNILQAICCSLIAYFVFRLIVRKPRTHN